MKKFLYLAVFIFVILMPFTIRAGIGISPPFIRNDRLAPGSHFEKTIYIIRGDPSEDVLFESVIDAPEFKDWIIVDNEFVLPKGQQQVPFKVIINVPSSAKYGVYQGNIRVRKKPEPGDSIVATGARIDINLIVTGGAFSDFNIKGSSIPSLEEGDPLFVLITLENIGNTKVRPSKIHLDIYDIGYTKILKSGDITETELVDPFETKQISGEMQVDLGPGEYWANVSIYKDEKIVSTSKVYFKVMPPVQVTIEEVEFKKREKTTSFIAIITFIILLMMLQ